MTVTVNRGLSFFFFFLDERNNCTTAETMYSGLNEHGRRLAQSSGCHYYEPPRQIKAAADWSVPTESACLILMRSAPVSVEQRAPP